jgi:hypothetical protein
MHAQHSFGPILGKLIKYVPYLNIILIGKYHGKYAS